MDERALHGLHMRLEVAEMLRDLGQNFHPLLNAVMKDINGLQADLLDQPQDKRPQVITPPSGPASSMLHDPNTGKTTQIPDPQIPGAVQELPLDRAQPQKAVDDSWRGVPNSAVAPGHVERRSE